MNESINLKTAKLFNGDEVCLGGYLPDPEGVIYPSFDINTLEPFLYGNRRKEADLRKHSGPRHNQKRLGSCVAQAFTKGLEIKRIQKKGLNNGVLLSALDLYYGCRERMVPSMVNQDSGTYLSTAGDVLKTFGVCREEIYPYDERKVFDRPSVLARRESYLNKISGCNKITSNGEKRLDEVIANLQVGNPVMFGTLVGRPWMEYKKGSSPLPPCPQKEAMGGHAITIVGWVGGKIIIENSWSETWGNDGYAECEPEMISGDCSRDFWTSTEPSDVWYEGSK